MSVIGWLLVCLLCEAPLLLFLVLNERRARRPVGKCRRCGYSLRGLAGPRCPECGAPFDAATGESTGSPPASYRYTRAILLGIAGALLIAALAITGGHALLWMATRSGL